MPTISKLLAAVLVLSPSLASAQLDFEWWDFKQWTQTGPFDTSYEGGWSDVNFSDGSVTLSPCAFHPSLVVVQPNIFCPLGTTGFIAQGDIDNDGNNDSGSFWSLAAVTRAMTVEPFRSDLFKILSAPPSGIAEILRDSGGETGQVYDVISSDVVVWYDFITNPGALDDYEITQFSAFRSYGAGSSELSRHYFDVPWGVYQYTLPALGSTDPTDPDNQAHQPVPFQVEHFTAPDMWPGRSHVAQGVRVLNENWRDGKLQIDPRLFSEFQWAGIDPSNTLAAIDTLRFSLRGNQYVEAPGPLDPIPLTAIPPTRSEIPPGLLAEATVTSVSCVRNADPVPNNFTVALVTGNVVTSNADLTVALTPGLVYNMEITSGALAGTTQQITNWGQPTPQDLFTPDDLSADLAAGDTFTLTGATQTIVTVNIDLTQVLEQGEVYQAEIASGELAAQGDRRLDLTLDPNSIANQYPIQIFGPQAPATVTNPDLTVFEFLTPDDLTAGVVTASVTAVAGNTVTTNRDLVNCLAGASYRLNVLTGAAAGATQFPIVTWGIPLDQDFNTLVPLALAPGDMIELVPEAALGTITSTAVAGHFVMGNMDLSGLVSGTSYVIDITSGALAGTTEAIRLWGFPNNFWFEAVNNLSAAGMVAGDTFELRGVSAPPPRLKIGDTIIFSQRFGDWVQAKYDAGEMLAVSDNAGTPIPNVLQSIFNIAPSNELIVDFNALDPITGTIEPVLYGVAREDLEVFPPFPIQTPPGDRNPFLLGLYDGIYEMGPFFFRTGDSATMRLTYNRNRDGGVITERVDRLFNAQVQFVDSYDGFALLGGFFGEGFPFGTPSSERAPDFDFDNDGISNLMEYAFQTDVADPASVPIFQFARDGAIGACTATILKRPDTFGTISYFIEYSGDLVNWTRITPTDPIFDIVVDDEDSLQVSNANGIVAGAFPPPSCFLRAVVEYNGLDQ